jgi:hypothetical protein
LRRLRFLEKRVEPASAEHADFSARRFSALLKHLQILPLFFASALASGNPRFLAPRLLRVHARLDSKTLSAEFDSAPARFAFQRHS